MSIKIKLQQELNGCEQPRLIPAEEVGTIETSSYKVIWPMGRQSESVWAIPYKYAYIRSQIEVEKLREENEKLSPLKDVARRLGEVESELQEMQDQTETIQDLKREIENLNRRLEKKQEEVRSMRAELKYVQSEKSALSRQLAMDVLMRERVTC